MPSLTEGKMPNLRVLRDDTIGDLVTDYLDAVREGRHTTGKRAQKKPRAATIATYESIISRVFLRWAEAAKLEPADLDDKALDKFTRYLQNEPGKNGKRLTAQTIASYARDVNTFLRWTAKRGATQAVRMVVEAPSNAARKKKMQDSLLRQDEIAKLVSSAKSLRDRIIVRILVETGCRLGELLSLTIADVHREDSVHYLSFVDRENGRRLKTEDSARTAAIAKDLFKDLRDYVNARPGSTNEDAPIFMSERRSRKNGYEPLNDSGVQQMIKHLAEDSGIAKPERVHAHGFRHLYAVEYLRPDPKTGVGGDPVTLAKILGHSGLTMINDTYTAGWQERDTQNAMLAQLERLKKRA
jgi:integrase